MKNIFILCIMILLAYPVLAAEWKQIEEKSYIDIASIQEYNDPSSYDKKRYNRNEKEFWIKSLNDKSSYFTDYEKTYNKKVWYIILKYIVDCNNKTIATKSGAIYDTNGNLIDSYDVEHILLNRNDIIPETRGENRYNIVCKYLDNNTPKIEISIIDNSDTNFEKVADEFEPYIDNLYERIKSQWNSNKVYKDSIECKIAFTIAKNGKLLHNEVFTHSSNSKFDNEAIKTIKNVAPFPPLPKEFNGQNIVMLFTFIN